MGRRGPKPKTASNSRKSESGVIDWSGVETPSYLSPPARKDFEALRETLTRLGTLEKTHPNLVELAARLVNTVRNAYAVIEKEGPSYDAPNGYKVPHPMLKVVTDGTMKLRGLYNDMGLSPVSSKLADATSAAAMEASSDDPIVQILSM